VSQASSAQAIAAKQSTINDAEQAKLTEDKTARDRFEQGCVMPQDGKTGALLALRKELDYTAFGDGAILCDRLGKTAIVSAGRLADWAVIQNWNAYREEKAARVQRNREAGAIVPGRESTLRGN
jgi:hypothetical protein